MAGFTASHKRLSLPCLPAAALLALQLSRALTFIPREKNAYTNGKKGRFYLSINKIHVEGSLVVTTER